MIISPQIVEGIKSGSYKEFEAFYKLFNAKLYHFVMKLSNGDSLVAEDVVQNTFIKLWENRSQLDPERNIITYVCTIARNILLNQYKRQTLTWVYEDFIISTRSDADETTEDNLNAAFLNQYIDTLIDKLPPACKRIFIMSRKEGLNNKEIAAQLQLSEKTVEAQLTKALSALRRHLRNYVGIFLTFYLMQ